MVPQILRLSCSWCNEMNDVAGALEQGRAVYCLACQHRADVLREACDCRRCTESKRLTEIRERGRAGWPKYEQRVAKSKSKPTYLSTNLPRRVRRLWRHHQARALILLFILIVSSVLTWIIAGR